MLLASTSDKVQVITGSAGQIDVYSYWMDYTSPSTISPGRKNTPITTAATIDIVLSPSGTTTRLVKYFAISNNHATNSNLITVQHTDGTNIIILEKITLLAGERLSYVEGKGFTLYDVNGVEKTNSTAAVFVARLASDLGNSTVTAAKVTGIDFPVGIGTWIFEYFVIYQTAAVTTGIKLGVNHSGTVTEFHYDVYGVSADTVATATQTALMDQDVLTATAGLLEAFAARAKSTSAPMITSGVDTANVNLLMLITGLCVVTASGNLELYSASEVAASNSIIKAGTCLRLTKIA